MKKIYLSLLFAIIFSAHLTAQWSDDPSANLKITSLAGEQVIPKVAVCPNGDYYIGYFSVENGNYNVRLQRLDSQGNIQWVSGGLLISDHPSMTWLTDWDMTADHENNAILSWQDIRSDGNNNVVAYRIAPDGSFAWGPDGIMLSNNTAFNVSPKVTVTAANNSVFAWMAENVVILQKISPTGEKLWGPEGITLSSVNRYMWPQMMPVGDDDILMKYYEDSGPSWSPTRHILAQRFNSSGTPVWTAPTIVSNAGAVQAWLQILPFVSDGSDGFYISWHDYRLNGNAASAWVQHVDAAGQPVFQANGALLSTQDGANQFYTKLAKPANDPNVYVYWNEVNGNQNLWGIYGQKISPDGSRLWGNTGKEIFPVTSQALLPQQAVPIENDVILIYEHYFNGIETSIRAVRLNSDGNFVWEPSETLISSVQSSKVHFDASEFSTNQWVFAWEDNRSGDVEIFAQNLMPTGELGISQESGTINGLVTIEGNMGDVTMVNITVGTTQVNPLPDGSFTMELIPGTYSLEASHPYTGSVTIEPLVIENGMTYNLTIELLMLRTTLECLATDQNGNPITAVEVEVVGPETSYSGSTSSNGLLNFENVPYGKYFGTASLDGAIFPVVLSDTIIDGENNQLVFVFLIENLSENKVFASMSVAPNPVETNSTIHIQTVVSGVYNLKLINSEGRLLNEIKRLNLQAGENDVPLSNLIHSAKLQQGIYLLHLSNGLKSSTVRFVVK